MLLTVDELVTHSFFHLSKLTLMPAVRKHPVGTGRTKVTDPKQCSQGRIEGGMQKVLSLEDMPGVDRRRGSLMAHGISLVRRGRERIQVEETHRMVSSRNPKWLFVQGRNWLEINKNKQRSN